MGFFDKKLEDNSALKPKVKKVKKSGAGYSCEACGLNKDTYLGSYGKGEKGIAVLVDNAEMDTHLLNMALKKEGLDLHRDCLIIPVIRCLWRKNPSVKQLKCCYTHWEKELREFNPKFIWLFGDNVLDAFVMNRDLDFDKVTISSLNGWAIPDLFWKAWVFPFIHPDDVKSDYEHMWKKDIKFAISCLNRKRPEHNKALDEIEVLLDYDRVCALLKGILKDSEYAGIYTAIFLDFETNTLPYFIENLKLLTISIDIDGVSYSFPFDYPHWNINEKEEIGNLFMEILINKKIDKIIHNAAFEINWTRAIFGIDTIENVIWDSMVVAHVLDSRKGLTKLKVLAYLLFGIEGYEKEMKKYIKEDELYNELEKMPLYDLCKYNAMDTRITAELALIQMQKMKRNKKMFEGYKTILHEGLLALIEMSYDGINVDYDYFLQKDKELEDKINEMEYAIANSEEVLTFKKQMGYDMNFNSPVDMGILLFDILKEKSIKKTKTGKASVDVEVLNKIKNETIQKYCELKKVQKIKGTYLAQFIRGYGVDGRIHPSFLLNVAESFRSSCTEPNVQNLPKRDDKASELIRKGIKPSKGNIFIEADYKTLEVCIQAVYSLDKKLISYICDKSTDMHKDSASDLFITPIKNVSKDVRFYSKNNFVFPQTYGSTYFNCAKNLWENVVLRNLKLQDGIGAREHLAEKGIKTYKQFEDHVRECEKRFWDRLDTTRQWRYGTYNQYLEDGYIDMLTGFRRVGFVSMNQICNTPVQGVAFHCLLWALIQVKKEFKKQGMKSKVVSEIHDAMLVDTHPTEKEVVKMILIDIMQNRVAEHFKEWLCVPLTVEIEEYKENWYE
jgi:DNA polymerase-1